MRRTFGLAWIVAKREFAGYFATPLAIVFLMVFVALAGAFAFYLGNFFDRGQADLTSFFAYHPWLFLLLVPAIAMRLWAEERKSGTIELLMTLPVSNWELILGKFFAGWAVVGVALLGTIPMWITVNMLGAPDNGVILTSYLGSLLVAGAFLAVGSAISATTRNQVIAFILAAVVCFLLVMSGFDLVLNGVRALAPAFVVSAIQSLSVLGHLEDFTRGLVSLPGLIYFASVIIFALFANKVILDQKKAA
jgi:ABC-2 type transport system permease protein